MTQKEKQLLLIAICGYLPYKVKCFVADKYISTISSINIGTTTLIFLKDISLVFGIDDVKPYLRPMSSMTEEEWVELGKIANDGEWIVANFYYSHHIDCWGLIPKGLALIAPKGMYNLNEE